MEFLSGLSLAHLLLPVLFCLATLGYIRCLVLAPGLTLFASAALAGLVSLSYPLERQNAPLWCAAAGYVLISLLLSRWRRSNGTPAPQTTLPAKEKSTDRKNIVIDGTNVLYWDGDVAELASLRLVVSALLNRGWAPLVFLDASSRHHLKDRSLTEKTFAKALDLPQNRVIVYPAGTEADAFLLKYARDHNLPVLSNDQFRDRPQIAGKLRLVRGIFANGKPIFDGL
ncbi:Zc3h12a-like Ribonuclease NYN domain protein [Sulfitobacter sp. THAF37]|uniref:NYN domain-containing protein n=1 Tax=Sulfitobacter sp. THAF37 TaxID=2587855 RepID=UPI001267C2D2|nr:hypothetical protein [Sulfitobacter sp. THAF37]QFT58393.1 Zc3h12a-like Ribonuclease NYN domain protein [Sulfitobacter sp. THAF37]